MYRQERMEQEQQEQQQIITKLGELPIVQDAYTQVLDIYQRTKGHNFLFRTSLGLAEYTAKAVAGKTVPVIYNGFQSHIDRVNDMACNQLNALEEHYPIITRPTEEVVQESKVQYEKVKPYVEPLMKPAKVAVDVGKTAMNVGKSAINMGTTVATTAMKPAVYAVNVGTAVTTTVVDTGKKAVGHVASGAMAKGQQVMDAGLSTPLGQFWLQQFDTTLDATEKLLVHYYLPAVDDNEENDGQEEEEREVATRPERVGALAKRIHTALYHKAEGDMVRYRLMAGNLTHEIMELTGHCVTLMKDGTAMAWRDRKDAMVQLDSVWNKYAQFIPEAVRPQDPLNGMVVVLGVLTNRLGELFANSKELSAQVNQRLSANCQDFLAWCQQSRLHLTENTGEVTFRAAKFINQLTAHLPHMLEMAQFMLDKVVDSMDVLVVDVPVELNEGDLCDVAMGNCNGMGVEQPVPLMGNSIH